MRPIFRPSLLLVLALLLVVGPAAAQVTIVPPTPAAPILQGTLFPGGTTAADAEVIAMEAVLRLRAAPSTDAAILDLLPTATPLDIIGRTPDSYWLAVRTDTGRVGWVWAEYLLINIDLTGVCVVDESSVLSACADLDADVTITILDTFRRGQANGMQSNVFAKVGDSITVSSYFLHPFGTGRYDLGAFANLQTVINWFNTGRIGLENPFERDSVAASVGWTAAAVLDPRNAPTGRCIPGETPLDCEYRIARPAIALIMFGTNDVGYVSEAAYDANLRRIVARSLELGVIPVLSTIPNRVRYEVNVQRFNGIVGMVAREYRVPLWDLYTATISLPDYGLTYDGVHLSEGPFGEDGAGIFQPDNLYYGYVIRNLTALQMLDAIWRVTGG